MTAERGMNQREILEWLLENPDLCGLETVEIRYPKGCVREYTPKVFDANRQPETRMSFDKVHFWRQDGKSPCLGVQPWDGDFNVAVLVSYLRLGLEFFPEGIPNPYVYSTLWVSPHRESDHFQVKDLVLDSGVLVMNLKAVWRDPKMLVKY